MASVEYEEKFVPSPEAISDLKEMLENNTTYTKETVARLCVRRAPAAAPRATRAASPSSHLDTASARAQKRRAPRR